MNSYRHLIISGLAVLGGSTLGLISKGWFFTHFYTPLMWTGYILLLDGINFALRKESLILTRTREFFLMLPLSVLYWLIFEFYNLFLQNWYYLGLPENQIIRYIGYIWAFSTIWPGVLETYELIKNLNWFGRLLISPIYISNKLLGLSMLVGTIFLMAPLILPDPYPRYLAALVWTGFVFLLDPILFRLNLPSLLLELKNGSLRLMARLFTAGAICGFWWEFWNYFAVTRWKYDLPFRTWFHIFEMPDIGFLGFLPFAVEIFLMWEITRYLFRLK